MSWMDLGTCSQCGKRDCEGWCDAQDKKGAIFFVLVLSAIIFGLCKLLGVF